MRASSFGLRLQPSLLAEARKAAKAEGVALNQLINVAVAEKRAALRTKSFFAARTARAVLKRAGVGKPAMKGDRMPRSRAR